MMDSPISIDLSSFVEAFEQAAPAIQIGVFFLSWLLLWLPIAIPIAIAVKWQPFHPLQLPQKLPLVASLYAIAPLVLGGLAYLKQRSFPAFGVSWNSHLLSSSALGLAIGTIGMAILFGVQTAIGWVHWKSENWRRWLSASLPTLLLGIWIGFTEEWVFRGFCFGEFASPSDFWSAAIVSSLIFAVLHLVWEGSENIPQLPGLALMGVVLCLAFVQDQNSIGLAWGLHAGWIWAIASLDAAEMLRYKEAAPEWLTGLDRKPLAGILGLVFLLGTGVVILQWV